MILDREYQFDLHKLREALELEPLELGATYSQNVIINETLGKLEWVCNGNLETLKTMYALLEK
jgi:hypothetical protein